MKRFRDAVWLVMRPKLVDVGEEIRWIPLGSILQVDEVAPELEAGTLSEAYPAQDVDVPLIESIGTDAIEEAREHAGLKRGWLVGRDALERQ